MYIPNPYFKNIPKLGDLEMDNIFLENGYPVLFTCKNREKIFLCVCRTVIDIQKWVISEINIQILDDMINNVISIHDAFVKNNGYACIARWSKTNRHEEYEVIKSNMLSEKDLPEKDVFLDDDGESLEYLDKVKNRINHHLESKMDSFFEGEGFSSVSISQITINQLQKEINEKFNEIFVSEYVLKSKIHVSSRDLSHVQDNMSFEKNENTQHDTNLSAA